MERQQFDREFKAQAVRLCEQGDVAITQVARELGINVKLLYRWRNEAQEAGAAEFLQAAAMMYKRLHKWRSQNLDASFDEIADQVTPQRRELVGVLLKQLAEQADEKVHAPHCEQCGQEMVYKGTPGRGVVHSEGEAGLEWAYYHCPDCESGLFPPGPSTQIE
jgi:transposase-like protein